MNDIGGMWVAYLVTEVVLLGALFIAMRMTK